MRDLATTQAAISRLTEEGKSADEILTILSGDEELRTLIAELRAHGETSSVWITECLKYNDPAVVEEARELWRQGLRTTDILRRIRPKIQRRISIHHHLMYVFEEAFFLPDDVVLCFRSWEELFERGGLWDEDINARIDPEIRGRWRDR